MGVMAYLGRARVGLTVRNLVAPTWEAAAAVPVETDRLVRVGLAWGPDPVRGRRSWSIAGDADLTTGQGPDGDRRALAVGAERWFREGRVAIRGGARAQTLAMRARWQRAEPASAFASGLLLEGQITVGE